MLSFLLEIHFWTLKDEISINNNDFGVFKYHIKKETSKSSSQERKKLYACSRNYHWTLSNKKPPKLRQNVKELEENVETHRIIRLKWIKQDLIIAFFNSGIIAYIRVNRSSGDIANVNFDKILKDKLSSLHISDIVTTNIFSVCCYNDPQLTLIHYGKPTFKKLYKKMSELEPRFISINLPGPIGRRLPRKLSVNKTGDVITVWWKYSDDDVFPWSPLVKDIDRANVHIFHINGSKVELMCYHRTEHDVLCVVFSSIEAHVLYVLEQKVSREGNIYVDIITFEIVKCSRLQRHSAVAVSLQSKACSVEFSPDRSNLLLGCVDGSVVLFNQTRALTHVVRTAFVPAVIKWHADGYLVAVGSVRGQIQCFDSALNNIKMQSLSEDIAPANVIDLTSYLSQLTRPQPPSLIEMEWSSKHVKSDDTECINEDGFLLLSFSGGPFVMLRIFSAAEMSPEFLVTLYLQADQVDKAINFLLSLDWDTNPNTCCSLLKEISNCILTSSTFSPSQKYSYLQIALSSFYSPMRPINNSIETEFYKPVKNISRRLFHYLLRYNLSKEAVTIANHLNEHDLFMDLYYYGNACEDSSLATMAWEKAEKILAEDVAANASSDSENCDCSCSECSCESEEHSDCSPENRMKNIQKLPSPIVVPSATRASFAAITRVNSTYSTNGEPSLAKYKQEIELPNSSNFVPSLNSSHINIPLSTKVQTEVPLNTKNSRTTDEPIPASHSNGSISNGITKELLHQTGLSDSKIKVVHFGVV